MMGNSSGARRFEYKDEKSSKFWEINVAGSGFTVRYGKIGTDGQTQSKEFADAAMAKKQAQKLIAEKMGKGYQEVVAKSELAKPSLLMPGSKSTGIFHHSKEITEYTPGLGNLTPEPYSYVVQVGDTVDVFKEIFGFTFDKGRVIEVIDHVDPVRGILEKLEGFCEFEEEESEDISRMYPLWGQRYAGCYLNTDDARSCIVEIKEDISITTQVASRILKKYPDVDISALMKNVAKSSDCNLPDRRLQRAIYLIRSNPLRIC